MTQTTDSSREAAIRALGQNSLYHHSDVSHHVEIIRPCGHLARIDTPWVGREWHGAGELDLGPTETVQIPASQMEVVIAAVQRDLRVGDTYTYGVFCVRCGK